MPDFLLQGHVHVLLMTRIEQHRMLPDQRDQNLVVHFLETLNRKKPFTHTHLRFNIDEKKTKTKEQEFVADFLATGKLTGVTLHLGLPTEGTLVCCKRDGRFDPHGTERGVVTKQKNTHILEI